MEHRMSGKKDNKINNKKTVIGSVPTGQRNPTAKHCTNKTNTNPHTTAPMGNPMCMKNTNTNATINNKTDNNCLLVTNKLSPTKTSRNQVNANWNSVAGTLKSQRAIPSNKKIGKQYFRIELLIWRINIKF